MPFDTIAAAIALPAPERLSITARDGFPLAAELFLPAGKPRGAVLMAGAMGVPRRFYASWARYLALGGLAVLTLDYRGFGDSRRPGSGRTEASLSLWVDADLPASLDALAEHAPRAPLLWCGHSVGGQLLGFVDTAPITGALMIGSQSGHWSLWDSPAWRLRMWLLSHALLPGAAALLGRMPGALMGGGEDLPAGVAREWAAWIRDHEYLGQLARQRDWADFARYDGALRLVTVSDDGYAPWRAGEGLLAFYRAARKEHLGVSPADAGVAAIGHFDAFRPKFRDSLWPAWRDWLLTQCGQRDL